MCWRVASFFKKRAGPGGIEGGCLPGPERPVDWRKIDRNLCVVYHLTPQQIDKMTLIEICLLLEDANANRQSMSDMQMMEEVGKWQVKTNFQKLEEAKQKNGR